jgi:asparagine synthase (glutamine-hydrolysing)
MCGIAGLVGFGDKKLLEPMLKALAHRGPDDQASVSFGLLGLGYRRLAVIDLKTGDQPFYNEDGSIVLFYNGEVYNFKSLRSDLQSLGHSFKTKSDGEVIVHGFEQWGENIFARLNGMFALALYDSSEKILYLARDHFGIKPLYYFWDKRRKRLLFSSEIKSLLLYPDYHPQPNDSIVYEYLAYRRHDHCGETFFAGIKKLLPGELLKVHPAGENWQIKKERFWTLKFNALESPRSRRDRELVERFRFLLEDSVRLRLMADVPVGVCLSGGLDSSTISLLISRLTEGPQKTFSAVFPGEKNDESDYIKLVNQKTAAESFLVYPQSDGLFTDLADLVRVQEEPFISSGPYAQYCVMREAAKEVKVLLDGQGGDELLAGYDPYFFVYLKQLLKKGRGGRFLWESLAIRKLLLKYVGLSKLHPTGVEAALLLDSDSAHDFSSLHNPKKIEDLKQRLYADVFKDSLPALLRYEDKNSSAFSLESRVPFLDFRLVEFIFNLPDKFLIRGGVNKYILRQAFKDLLPKKIYRRRWKVGFTTPEDVWFRKESEKVLGIFRSAEFGQRPYWQQEKVLAAFDHFLAGQFSDSMVFWRLLNTEIWLREFIDR